MSVDANGGIELLAIFLVATLFSVIGSLAGYGIGLYAGRPEIENLSKTSLSRKLDELIARYGDAGVFIAALSPIPYKLLAWMAGAGRMDMRTFISAGIFGRGIRFGLEVLIVTVDIPVPAKRFRDIRNGFTLPFRLTPRTILDFALHPKWTMETLAAGTPRFENMRRYME